MIIIELAEGLGNQLFCYAFGRAVSLKLKTDLKFNLEFYYNSPNAYKRPYRLNCFNIDQNFASHEDISRVRDGEHLNLGQKFIFKFRRKYLPLYYRPYIPHKVFEYDPSLKKVLNNTYLYGLFQTEKYFHHIEDILRNDLKIIIPSDEKNLQILNDINNCNSISLHHRRTDFLSDYKKNDHQFVADKPYYTRALSILQERVKNPVLYVFSDDPDWARKNLIFKCQTAYIDNNTNFDKHIEDFRLMSHCKHNIISTSTFSWWAAWLNKNPEKIVIAPDIWFTAGNLNTKDVIPTSWYKINAL